MGKNFVKALLLAGLLMTAAPTLAQSPDAQRMLDEMLKNAPPDLKPKMEGELKRQREGGPDPVYRGPKKADISVPAGPVDIAKFLSGNWVGQPFKVNCDKGRPEHGPYIHGHNHRFEVRDGEIWQYDRTWGGPGYNFTFRTRYRILDVEKAKKDAGPYAKQVASIRVQQIGTELIEGRGSPTGPRFKEIPLFYGDNVAEGFKGRQIGPWGALYSCEGEFARYDSNVAPTQGLTR